MSVNDPSASTVPVGVGGCSVDFGSVAVGWNTTVAPPAGLPSKSTCPRTGYTFTPRLPQPASQTNTANPAASAAAGRANASRAMPGYRTSGLVTGGGAG